MDSTLRSQPTLPALAKFRLYRKALQWTHRVQGIAVTGNLRDQLHRAAHSVVLNIAAGGAERTPKLKKRYYAIARASLWESSAVLDLLRLDRHRFRVDAAIVTWTRDLDAILGTLLKMS